MQKKAPNRHLNFAKTMHSPSGGRARDEDEVPLPPSLEVVMPKIHKVTCGWVLNIP